jgi:hypothetical protein
MDRNLLPVLIGPGNLKRRQQAPGSQFKGAKHLIYTLAISSGLKRHVRIDGF